MICSLANRFFLSSVNWAASSSQILSSLKKEIKINPHFIKENGIFITHHIADMMQKHQYENTLRFLREVNTKPIDKWQAWIQLSKTINGSINNLEKIQTSHLYLLMEILFKLRYQPHSVEDKEFCQLISQKIEHHINDLKEMCKISTFMLVTQLYAPYRNIIQNNLLKYFQGSSSVESQKIYTFIQGVVSSFWTKQFYCKTKIILSKNAKFQAFRGQLEKYLTLPDQDEPTKREKKFSKSLRSSTEKKIGEMLSDLGYVFEENVYINNTEVDFLFGQDIIISYNGMQHYRINNKIGKIGYIRYDAWKNRMLQKRMFKLLHIPFYEWQKLENEKTQKQYLIQKVQNFTLKARGFN